jgi:hypothetical protein
MWRWIIRVWVSIVVFWILMYFCGGISITVARLMARIGLPFLLQFFHTHALLTMFLIGVMAGEVVLGPNITGRGWFRSKSGLTYEGLKLEKIKSWTWLLFSPVFLLGVVSWIAQRSESGVISNLTLANFYQDVLMPNCSLSWWKNNQLYRYCGEQLLFVGVWMASIGYSLSPLVRRHGSRLLRSMRNAQEVSTSVE